MKIFGFTLGKKDVVQKESPNEKSFTLPTSALDDGAVNITQNAYYGTYVDLEGSVRNELELITRYREMANHPELEAAIDDIVNEAITHNAEGKVVEINVDNIKQSETIKKKIIEEYNYILRLLNFSNLADDLFRRWYVDGRINFHVIVNEKNPSEGIKELRYIDPRKIRKIREIDKERDPVTGANIIKSIGEYYVYNDKGTTTQTYTSGTNQGIRIATDSIINVNSGLMDAKNTFVISNLHSAIRPLNQLRMIEDAIVVYRLCLIGDTRIKTNTGWQYIKDIKENDTVYSYYGPEIGLKETLVKKQWKTGTKQTYTVSSKHFSITGTHNHPLLVLDKKTNTVEYVDIENIIPKRHCFVYKKPNNINENVEFPLETIIPDQKISETIFTSSDNTKKEIVLQFCENNGDNEDSINTGTWSSTIKSTNKIFIEDIKELWTSLGLASTLIKQTENYWYITIYDYELPEFENILNVTVANIEDVYELEVVSEKHNFIANGITVHNSRAPERRVFYIDVGNLPKGKAEQYLRDVMIKYRNKMTYDSATGCLAMDTKIPLLDGRTLTIDEITKEIKTNKNMWAYSCDPITGKFVPGLITWAGVTQKSAKVMRITFDNGKSIVCTLDHKHVTKEHGFVEAKDLQIGNSMMPYYEKYMQTNTNKIQYPPHVQSLIANCALDNLNTQDSLNYISNSITEKDFYKFIRDAGFDTWENYKESLINYTHNITNIEYLDDEIEVGTLTIDGDEIYHDHHTFALECGIFTKNSVVDSRKHLSMLEDFFLPRREGCVTENTKIKLLDGRDVELRDLITEYKIGKENWVYSVSPEGKIVPGKISWAGYTRKDAEILDIHLDNGEIITTTPDHKFILRNGVQVEAKDLQPGTSLMPLYTREHFITHNTGAKYLQIKDNIDNKWKFVHNIVGEFILGPRGKNQILHHIDFNRYNNLPSNLMYMDKLEHFLYHSKNASEAWNINKETRCKNLSIAGKAFFETEQGIKRRKEIAENNKVNTRIINGGCNGREKVKQLRAEDKLNMTHEEYLAKWSPGLSKMDAMAASLKAKEINQQKYLDKTKDYSLDIISDIIKHELSKNINCPNRILISNIQKQYPNITYSTLFTFLSHNGYSNINDFIYRNIGKEYVNKKRMVDINNKLTNHKVVKVVFREDREDVGTLTIDENHEYHDYHNFALTAGVFVMNSRGTEITTLPAGAALNDLPDLEYFKKKLLQSLHVPYSRMDNDNGGGIAVFGRSAETSRDELKFSKFVQKLRNKFTQLFDEALRIQLVLKGICSTEEWEDFKEDIYYDFRKDNNFVELREAELIRERMITLQQVDLYVGKYFSETWVKKNILRMTDEKIEEMEKEMQEDGSAEKYQQQLLMQQGIGNPPAPIDNTFDSETSASMTPNLDSKVSKYSP